MLLPEKISQRRFVVTNSLRPHLQELALAVSDGKAVVLEGKWKFVATSFICLAKIDICVKWL